MKSLRYFFGRLPPDGNVRHLIRRFNQSPKAGGVVPSVKSLAEGLGFAVERRSLPHGISGRLVQDAFASNGFRIEVNENESIFRQRWTVMHEIGHYYLHLGDRDPFSPVRYRDRQDPFYQHEELEEEREADAFAAAVFFDEGALEAAHSLLGGDLQVLARHFGVSPEAVGIAMRQLKR